MFHWVTSYLCHFAYANKTNSLWQNCWTKLFAILSYYRIAFHKAMSSCATTSYDQGYLPSLTQSIRKLVQPSFLLRGRDKLVREMWPSKKASQIISAPSFFSCCCKDEARAPPPGPQAPRDLDLPLLWPYPLYFPWIHCCVLVSLPFLFALEYMPTWSHLQGFVFTRSSIIIFDLRLSHIVSISI